MISHNLMPLERCALVYVERKGKGRVYRLNTETMEKIFEAVERHAQKSCPAKGKCANSR